MHILKDGQIVQTATFKDGQIVQTDTSQKCIVEKFLGGGGQGEVYRADVIGTKMALKWYFPAQATQEQCVALDTLIKKGPPSDKFLWPSELTKSAVVPGFGYIMPLRGPQYKSIVDLMKRQAEPTFRALATAGLQLADSFLTLHATGLCYRDISFGNVFFEPNTGEALICDNDNVAVDGETESGVLGTPRFMAPEIVRSEARPSMQTDLYSLAVLLFYMLMVHHPLEGKRESSIKCLDLPAMNKLYGTDPLFIFDPNNDTNLPVAGFHDNALAFWPLYPVFVRDLFIKAFTVGLHDPQARVRESEWRAAMARMRDAIFYCPKCGAENFYSAEKLKVTGNPGTCWACDVALVLPPRIRIEDAIVMLNWDTKLYPHHVDNGRLYNFSEPVAEVNQHPTDSTIWGLRNLTDEKWVITTDDGAILDVEPGRNVRLAVGTKINFGKKEGEIRI